MISSFKYIIMVFFLTYIIMITSFKYIITISSFRAETNWRHLPQCKMLLPWTDFAKISILKASSPPTHPTPHPSPSPTTLPDLHLFSRSCQIFNFESISCLSSSSSSSAPRKNILEFSFFWRDCSCKIFRRWILPKTWCPPFLHWSAPNQYLACTAIEFN